MLAPIEVVDYVVVHELMHLVEKNHTRHKFWARVEAIMPDHKKYRDWLKHNGAGLTL